jgi:hypothetical protein
MNKVYSDKGEFFVEDIQDMYYIRCVDKTSLYDYHEVLTWTRMVDLSNYAGNPVRMYDVEFEDKKYFFLLYEDGGKLKLKVENTYEFDELCNKKNITIIPDIYENPN